MFTDNLDLGFATVSVTANSKPIVFEAKKNSLDSYWLDDGTEVHPAGCINIIVNVLPYQVGDVLCAEFDHGVLTYDGGGERLLNIVGAIGEYTVAMVRRAVTMIMRIHTIKTGRRICIRRSICCHMRTGDPHLVVLNFVLWMRQKSIPTVFIERIL